MEKNQIEHIPIDYDIVPSISFFDDNEYMHGRVEKCNYDYRNCIDMNALLTELYGFKFLNSIDHFNNSARINYAIESTLPTFKDERLLQIRQKWNDHNDLRENTMLENIYKYSKKHQYEKGLFLIGAAHRVTIIDKIKEYDKKEEIKLNWIISKNGDNHFE